MWCSWQHWCFGFRWSLSSTTHCRSHSGIAECTDAFLHPPTTQEMLSTRIFEGSGSADKLRHVAKSRRSDASNQIWTDLQHLTASFSTRWLSIRGLICESAAISALQLIKYPVLNYLHLLFSYLAIRLDPSIPNAVIVVLVGIKYSCTTIFSI